MSLLVMIEGIYCYHFKRNYPKNGKLFGRFFNIFAILTNLKENEPHKYFWNYWLWKTWLFKRIKGPVSENPSAVNELKSLKNFLKSMEKQLSSTFLKFLARSENWGCLVSAFCNNAPFFYPLKTSENLKIFWYFQGVEKVHWGQMG